MRGILLTIFVIIVSILLYSAVYKIGYNKGQYEAYDDCLVLLDSSIKKVYEEDKIFKWETIKKKDTVTYYFFPKHK